MLENWLSPVDTQALSIQQLPTETIGRHIHIYEAGAFPDLSGVQLAFLGTDEVVANAVRAAFYPLAHHFPNLAVADLGNIRNTSIDFLIPIIKELLESRIIPVIIGPDPRYIRSQYKAFQHLIHSISLAVIDDRIAISPEQPESTENYLNDIVLAEDSRLFHLGLVGPQLHFTPSSVLRLTEQRLFDCIRLGKARTDISELEPLLRDADLIGFNLSALKSADAPASANPSPSGFLLEEACQLCKYAGMSDKLKAFGLFGYRPEVDNARQTALAVSMMLWYFIDGFQHRKGDFPVSLDGLTEYIVDIKNLNYQLTFWKSNRSGRWWMQIPIKTRRRDQRHRLLPCSYADYQLAASGELPDRLFQAFKRFL